ncbi:pyroglutamyl-peptidase I . Cysteine peptidase. MEROPS family C15 [Bifidobacterium commune]|uniref:Pyroglutamyl-peptidase I n=2 Tax=Bifidobacterium commune TaxID=1505727 RepID=A0A1C4H4J6_9BIFI|nr:pyroglutamyl-peptidase I . Cysteine peptidase. MEROPS family C15 [Bifidobacterium commune]
MVLRIASAKLEVMERLNVVISGFEPYEGVKDNPSHIVPQKLVADGLGEEKGTVDDDLLADVDFRITAVDLPVSFKQAWPRLKETLEAVQPDIVIATGLKTSARGILLERCANNIIDTVQLSDFDETIIPQTEVADEPQRKPIASNGPATFWTRLPLRAILNDFGSQGIASALSSDAGTFVCNSLFYNLMEWTSAQSKVLSGFVSLPIVNEQPHPQHGLPLNQQVEACRVVVRQTARYFLEPVSSSILID